MSNIRLCLGKLVTFQEERLLVVVLPVVSEIIHLGISNWSGMFGLNNNYSDLSHCLIAGQPGPQFSGWVKNCIYSQFVVVVFHVYGIPNPLNQQIQKLILVFKSQSKKNKNSAMAKQTAK